MVILLIKSNNTYMLLVLLPLFSISINHYIVGLISIKSNIIWRWRRLRSIKSNLPLRATTVATKTTVATAMAGAQTINKELRATAAMAQKQ
jgi:hypothetical protein